LRVLLRLPILFWDIEFVFFVASPLMLEQLACLSRLILSG
jgi:hypothetical protein